MRSPYLILVFFVGVAATGYWLGFRSGSGPEKSWDASRHIKPIELRFGFASREFRSGEAVLEVNGKPVQVKIRGKSDEFDLDVLSDMDEIEGSLVLKKVVLADPNSPHYIFAPFPKEYVFQTLLSDLGLVSRKFDFVHLRFGDEERQLYFFQDRLSSLEQVGFEETDQALDAEKVGLYFAAADLFGWAHASHSKEYRFWKDPKSGLYEIVPAGFEIWSEPYVARRGRFGFLSGRSGGMGPRYYPIAFVMDHRDVQEAYVKGLARLASQEFESYFLDRRDQIESRNKTLTDRLIEGGFPTQNYLKIQSYFRGLLNPRFAVNAYLKGSSKRGVEIELGNIHSLPVEIRAIRVKDRRRIPIRKRVLYAKPKDLPVRYERVTVPIDEKVSSERLQIEYSVLGLDQTLVDNVHPGALNRSSESDFLREPPSLAEFKGIKVEGNRITFAQSLEIDRPLRIPKGYSVHALPGSKIVLSSDGKIVSDSPIFFQGSKSKPVRVMGRDGGQGIAVFQTETESILENVVFEGLSSLRTERWQLTGAITFYEAPALIRNCQFLRNQHGDDYLNLIRSSFRLENSEFKEVLADAIDSDFSKGQIANVRFVGVGNDGVDVSGGRVRLANLSLNQIGDKGISAGERSVVSLDQIRIHQSSIALASKDGSRAKGKTLRVSESRVGVAVFRKKGEFDSASVDLTDARFKETKEEVLLETDSNVRINGKQLPANARNLSKRFY